MAEKYDVIIIGAGHNGLTCAAYLAAKNKRVCVLEARNVVGGAAVTEEFHPGFRNSVASYTVSLLNPKIIADLELARYGLEIIRRPMGNFWPLPNDNYLTFPIDESDFLDEFRRFSERDAAAYPRYAKDIEYIADVVRDLVLEIPPNPKGGIKALFDAIRLGNRFRKLSIEDQQLLLELFTLSAADFLARYFENDTIKAAFAFDGVVGNYASPYSPGSAYVLLHHCFGEVNGIKGAWGHAIGGMGSITQAMAKCCQARGVNIRTNSAVAKVIVSAGAVTGVQLENGEIVHATKVAANCTPKRLFLQLLDEQQVPPFFLERIRHQQSGSGTFRMNVALSELPQFACKPSDKQEAHHSSGIVIAPSMDYMDKAWQDAKQFGWSKQPIVEMLIPSTIDSTLAPEGMHVASLFCQQFAPKLAEGKHWKDYEQAAAETIIDTVTAFAPNFKSSILGMQLLSPWGLEQKFGLSDGDIFHGALSLNQMFSARPMLGYGDYQMPIKGLYLCGSGAHPGGGVTGAPGHNAAKVILRSK